MSSPSETTEFPSSSAAGADEHLPVGAPGRCQDDSTVVQVLACAPVPGFLSADASLYPADGEGVGRTRAAATPTLETEVERLRTALKTAARNRPARIVRGGRLYPPPGRAIDGSGILTAMLSRPGFAVAGMALASLMIAAAAGTFAYVMLPQTDDWDLAALPPAAPPSLPDAATAAAVVHGGAAGLQAQPDSAPPAESVEVAALPPTPDRTATPEPAAIAAPEGAKPEAPATMPEPAPPARSEMPAATAAEPELPERAVIMLAAPTELAPGPARQPAPPPPMPPPLAPPLLEPPPAPPAPPAMAAPAPSPHASQESLAMAPREPAPPARSEPPPGLIAIKRMAQAGRPLAPGPAARAGFQFADSSVRYLAGAELQRLSPDRLRIARNEIFARNGRYFKDDALRAYFSQFAWYQPRAWDVPLNPVEVANVSLMQSIEDAGAAPTRSIGEPVAAATEPGTARGAFPDPRRHYLTPAELQGLSMEQLILVRNEIFARKGRYFRDPALRAYFEQFPWYQPYAWDVPLSQVERANVDLIQAMEQSRAGRLPPM